MRHDWDRVLGGRVRPEYGLPVGTRIDDERVNELFEQDIQVTISECEKLFSNFNDLPDEVQKICAKHDV